MEDEMPIIRLLRYSKEAVEAALARGEEFHFEEALPTMLDEFFGLADTLGVCQKLDELPDPRKSGEGYIPVPIACAVTICRFLYAMDSFRRVGKVLLRDHALLQKLGVAPTICEKGFYRGCARDDDQDEPDEAHKPFDIEAVLDLLNVLCQERVQAIIVTFIRKLRRRHPELFRRGLFVMDSNHFRLKGSKVGYKWCALMLWTPYGMIPVAMEFSATAGEGTGETSVGRRVVERALKAYGEGFMKMLLMDSGYLDGPGLHWMKYEHGIDWMMDPRDDMKITESVLGHMDDKPKRPWRMVEPPRLDLPKDKLPTRRVMWMGSQGSFFTYGEAVNATIIWDHYPPDEEHPQGYDTYEVLITSRMDWGAVQMHNIWRLRWCIENTFGAMTNTWGLGKWQIERLGVYQATVLFMALTFGLLVVYLYEQRLKIPLRGIADRLQRQAKGKVLVLCGGAAVVATTAMLNDWLKRGLLRGSGP